MTRKQLTNLGYNVTAKMTGAEYPNYAPSLGCGWQFILSAPSQADRRFTTSDMAWAFAQRLADQIPA
jgi:hypothetical protein